MPGKNYAGFRFSGLDQINDGNANNLQVAWTFSVGVLRGQEAAPIVADNTMFVVTPYPNILYALDLTAFSPDSFFVSQIVGVLVMAIIGGLGSISGALVGAAIISVLAELLRRIEGGLSIGPLAIPSAVGISELVFGVALIVMLRWRPAGVLGAQEAVDADPEKAAEVILADAGRAALELRIVPGFGVG